MAIEPAKMHPVLNHFYSKFIENNPEASGTFFSGNMDDFKVTEIFKMTGEYFVCNSAINLNPEKRICFSGAKKRELQVPGGSLLAGRVVNIKTSELILAGSEEDPVEIIGLEGVSLTATKGARLQHAIIYLLANACFSLDASAFSHFNDVSVVRIKEANDELFLGTEFNWKTYEDYIASSSEPEEGKNRIGQWPNARS